MAWQKISDKLYQIQLDGKWVDLAVPYAKVEKIFSQFVGSGGLLDSEGKVTTDIVTLISNFTSVGDILLTTYGPKGSVKEEGDCGNLSASETVELFKVAADIIENFIRVIMETKKGSVMTETAAENPQTKTE